MNKKLNLNFIEELERNSKIFDDKINKLNSGYEENSQKNIKAKKYKFIKKKNLNQKEYFNTENNYEENPFKKEENKYKDSRSKLINKRYDLDLNDLNNVVDIKRNKGENIIYNNTIDNNNLRRYNNKNDFKDEYLINNDPDKQLIEELRQTINQKTNFIKLLKSEIESKNKLPTQEEYDEINTNYENILNELKSTQKIVKTKDEEIDNLKMRLNSILAQNKNMKAVITKKENELEKMKLSMNTVKEEIKSAKNRLNEENINQKQISRDYEMLNQKYKLILSEKEKLSKELEETKTENFNLKKDNIQLKKLIDKLKEDIKIINSIKIDSNNKKNFEKIEQNQYKIIENKNENHDLTKTNIDKNIKNEFKPEIKKISNPFENKNIISKNKAMNNKNKKLDETEEIIYNNDDDESDEEEEKSNREFSNYLRNKIYNKSIKKNFQSETLPPKERKSIKIKKDFLIDEKDNNKEYIALIKKNGKIIGCNREKIKSLIKGKEYQIIEKEINALIKEKGKIESDLLKMPERPRKLNDIKNKKEINDAINKIENDINFIRNLLKSTDDYYIN